MTWVVPRALVVPAVLLAVVLVGCGGDSEDAGAAPATPSASPSVTPSPGLPGLPGVSPSFPGSTAGGSNPGLPTDFPTAVVPLLPGPVSLPLGPGSGPEGKLGWVLELDLARDAGECFEEAEEVLLANGFTKQPGAFNEDGNRQAQYTTTEWAVILSTSPTDAGGCRLGYSVGQLGGQPAR